MHLNCKAMYVFDRDCNVTRDCILFIQIIESSQCQAHCIYMTVSYPLSLFPSVSLSIILPCLGSFPASETGSRGGFGAFEVGGQKAMDNLFHACRRCGTRQDS